MTDSKSPKAPPLSENTKILSFDLETNGLHGKAFAVGAVVMDGKSKVYSEFIARSKVSGDVDPWVKQNVLPAIADLRVTHENYEEMREAFWAWYTDMEPKSDYVLVNNGYPVEYRFLLDCQETDLEQRYWDHPFPLLDLASLLIQIGQNPTASKSRLGFEFFNTKEYSQHNPLHDAKVAIMVAFKAFKLAGRI